MAQTVIGIFDSSSDAQNAVQQLVSNGISRSNIDISDRSTSGTTTDTYDNNNDDSISGFFRSLFGSDDNDADKYSRVASRGCTVTVHAQSTEEAQRAADLLDDYGAVDVDERSQQYGTSTGYPGATGSTGGLTTGMMGAVNTGTTTTDSDYNSSNNLTNDYSGDRTSVTNDRSNDYLGDRTDDYSGDRTNNFTNDTDRSIPIIEENLQVGKRETETGGVRLRSRIVERPVEEHLRLREEHVHVERNPVNRPASDADLDAFQEGTIELTEHAEVPVVNKEARVVEEITLDKEVTERDEVVRDTVRKTEVDIDNLNTTDENRRFTNDTDTNYNNDTDYNTGSGAGSTRILDTDADRNRDRDRDSLL